MENIEKIIETIDILGVVNNLKDEKKDLNKIYLRAKDRKTGNTKGIGCNYVAYNMLFMYLSDDINNKSINGYLRNLEGEATDSCWNDYAEANNYELLKQLVENHEAEPGESLRDVLSNDDMQKLRYDYVTSMKTYIYPENGDEMSCPIENFDKTKNIKSIELSDNSITLVY